MAGTGERVLKIREALGLTQAQFAAMIGLKTGKSISRIECGETKLTSTNAEAICAKFFVNKEFLLEGKGQMFSEDLLHKSIKRKLNKLTPQKLKITEKFIDCMLELDENQ